LEKNIITIIVIIINHPSSTINHPSSTTPKAEATISTLLSRTTNYESMKS
jgi:hypothetical protein